MAGYNVKLRDPVEISVVRHGHGYKAAWGTQLRPGGQAEIMPNDVGASTPRGWLVFISGGGAYECETVELAINLVLDRAQEYMEV